MRTVNHNSDQVDANSNASQSVPRRKPSEDGFTLLTVIFIMTILTLWLSVAVPKMTRSIQRDHEVETMRRGKQYIRAVQLYYRKFHAYPPTMDALVQTNQIRFLRKKYIDPMTGKDDWKPLMFGQNKQPIVFGFFGQALTTGSTLAGIGASGGNGINGLNGAAGSGGGSQCATGSLASIFTCQQGGATPGPTSGTGTNGQPIAGSGSGGLDANGNPIAGSGTGGTDASGGSASTTGTNGATGTNGLSSSGPTSGQTFGGAGIIGVMPASPKVSLLIYKKTTHYNQWEFDYDPAMETMMVQGGNTGMIGTPASGMSNPIGNSGFGSSNNTFGNGQTGSTPFSAGQGSPPSSPTPTSPQQ